LRLAELYAQDGQWTEAVQLLERVVQLGPDRSTRKEVHWRLANLWDEKLGESERALTHLQAVLDLDPRHPDALARLSEVHIRDGRLKEAAAAAARLLNATDDATTRAAALVQLARIEEERHNHRASIEALREAIVLEGTAGNAAKTFRRFARAASDWESYVDALRLHGKGHELSEDARAALHLEAARVLTETLHKTPAALRWLEDGLEATGGHTALRLELAFRLRMCGESARALPHLQSILQGEPWQVDTWRQLAVTFDELGQPDAARIALEPLLALHAATQAEQHILTTRPATHAPLPAHVLTAEVIGRVSGYNEAEGVAAELLALIDTGLGRLFPLDLDAYGLSPRDKIATRGGHPLRSLAETLGQALGVFEFDLYVHRVRARGLAIELGSVPSILLPASLSELTYARQAFVLMRALGPIAQRVHAAEKLTRRELEVLLAAAARLVDPNFGTGLTGEDELNAQCKRIYRAVPRKHRKHLEAVATRYVAAGPVDFGRFIRKIEQGAVRTAALVADDLHGSIEVLRDLERDRERAALSIPAYVKQAPVVIELLRFWCSDAAYWLRHALGRLPPLPQAPAR
ncbi:MAG: tetratricopeptide repeat protein, partial [Polyangiales bacterium]